MRKPGAILLFALAVLLNACAVAATGNPATIASFHLAGTRWRFVEVENHAVASGVNATLLFDANGRAAGHAGCNAYGGAYRSDTDGALQLSAMISTKMACLQPAGAMEVERGVFDALRRTVRVRDTGGELDLQDANGAVLAKLVPQSGS